MAGTCASQGIELGEGDERPSKRPCRDRVESSSDRSHTLSEMSRLIPEDEHRERAKFMLQRISTRQPLVVPIEIGERPGVKLHIPTEHTTGHLSIRTQPLDTQLCQPFIWKLCPCFNITCIARCPSGCRRCDRSSCNSCSSHSCSHRRASSPLHKVRLCPRSWARTFPCSIPCRRP